MAGDVPGLPGGARAGEVRPGRIHVWRTGAEVPRFVLNFPTKRHWRSASLVEDVEAGLVDLVVKIRELEIRSVAVPALGAGHGGLDRAVVRPRIEAALAAVSEVEVLLWEPGPRAGP